VSPECEPHNLAVRFEDEVGDVMEAEVQLIESFLGDLVQHILMTRKVED